MKIFQISMNCIILSNKISKQNKRNSSALLIKCAHNLKCTRVFSLSVGVGVVLRKQRLTSGSGLYCDSIKQDPS